MFYLTTALVIVWVAVTAYVIYMSSRQRALEGELHTLEEMMQEQQARQARPQK